MKKPLLELLTFSQVFTEREWHLKYKIAFLNSVFLMAAVIAFGMGFYRWQLNPLMGAIDFGFSAMGVVALAYLRRHKEKVELIATLAIILCFLLFYAIYLLAPYNTMRLSLFFLLAAAAFFLKGRTIGLRWFFFIIFSIVLAHLAPGLNTGYSNIDIITTCLYLAALFVIFWNYETVREEQAEREHALEFQSMMDERWRMALEGAGDAIWDWNLQTNRFIYSKRYAEMLGYTEQEFGDTPAFLEKILHPDEKREAMEYLYGYLHGDCSGQYISEHRLRCKDGSYKWILCRGRVTQRDASGRPLRLMGTHVDTSQRKALEMQLEHVAHYDALTGVPNRVLLADRMQQTLARARREHSLVAVCYLDLDGFKAINDRHGHEVGDRVLVEITRRIRDTIREDDTVARLGGDEFVLLLAGLQAPEECVGSLHRLLQRIAQPIVLAQHTLTVSASIGVALYPEDEQDPDTLLRHADQAMYVAKQSGKNRFHLFDPANDQRARLHHALLQELRSGLQQGEFELYYQPQVELATRRLTGVEALIRWHHPQRGLLVPADFLRAIESTELESELGDWVIARAFDQLRAWRESGEAFQLSVNVSAHQLQAPGFAAHLRQLMGQCCPQPCLDCLKLEILETVALEDFEHIGALIRECREIGIGFALDDFGTGYSSLTYLSHLDVDVLKIDQSFVRDMLQQPGERAIVQGIVALAKAFGRGVIAEGVETEAQWQALRGMGCDIGQGNGIAPPMPAHELLAWRARFEGGEGWVGLQPDVPG